MQWAKHKKDRQYNGQNKRRIDNTLGKTKEEQIQWAKQKKDRQYYDQNKRRAYNEMGKTKEG